MFSLRFSFVPLVLWATVSAARGQELLPGTKGVQFGRVYFSPDGAQLLAVADRPRGRGFWTPDALWLLDRVRGTSQVLFKPGVDQQVLAAAFSPDGKLIVAGGHCCWAGWEVPSLKEWFLIKGCPEALDLFTVVAFSAPHKTNTLAVNVIHRFEYLDGRQGSDSKVLLWHLDGRRKEEVFRLSKDKINFQVHIALDVSPSGRLLAFIDPTAKRLKVLDVEPKSDPKERAAFPLPGAKENDGSRLRFAPDERSVWRLDTEHILTQFDLKTKKTRTLKLEERVDWFQFLPEEPGLLVVRFVEKPEPTAEVQFIRTRDAAVVSRLTLPKVCNAYALSPDGRWLAGCANDGGIYLWDTRLWRKQRQGS